VAVSRMASSLQASLLAIPPKMYNCGGRGNIATWVRIINHRRQSTAQHRFFRR
jgi:hypothetical protein